MRPSRAGPKGVSAGRRFGLVEPLRGVAALAVVFDHIGESSVGNRGSWWATLNGRLGIGVTLFFLISGLLLYRPFAAAARGQRSAPRIATYAARRALRIVPGYWFVLTALAVFPGLVGVFSPNWWRYYTFGQIYGSHTYAAGLPQAWSLCTEVTFYAMLPVYGALVRRLGRSRSMTNAETAELVGLATLVLVAVAFRRWIFSHNGIWIASHGFVQQWLFANLDWFALGMGLGVASLGQDTSRLRGLLRSVAAHPLLCWGSAGAVWGTTALLHISAFDSQHYVDGVVCLLVLLPATLGERSTGIIGRGLRLRPIVYAGTISYSVYLLHQPIVIWLHGHGFSGYLPLAAATLLIVLSVSALVYHFVERPALAISPRDSGVRRAADRQALVSEPGPQSRVPIR